MNDTLLTVGAGPTGLSAAAAAASVGKRVVLVEKENRLGGAPIPFAPTVPMPWAPVAPPLAGLPGFSDAHVVTLLTTGARPDRTAPRPPMPAFQLTDDEARAVVAYLRHLAPRH